MRALFVTLSAAALVLGLAATASAQTAAGVTVDVRPQSVDGAVGDTFDIEVVVVNSGTEPTPSLAAHIDVTDPSKSSSVDPEDWTPTLTRPVGVVDPGRQVTVRWTIQPISPGNYVLYAVALVADRQAEPAASVSNAVPVAVTERRSLNPSGVLPVVLIVPIVLGSAILVRRRRLARADRASNPAASS